MFFSIFLGDFIMKRYLTALFVSVILIGLSLISPVKGLSQWVSTNGPYGGYINSLTVVGNNLWAGTSGGLLASSDEGESWIITGNGLPDFAVMSVKSNETFMYAGLMGGGVYKSSDKGVNWEEINNGLTSKPTGKYVYALALKDEILFAATRSGVFRSTNSGLNWELTNNGLTNTFIWFLGVSGSNLFAGTVGGGVFRSTDNGDNWSIVANGLSNTLNVRSLVSFGQYIFVGTWGDGIFGSTDNGEIWTKMNTGLTNLAIYSIAYIGEKLYAGTYGDGVFESTDNGMTWTQTGLTGFLVSSIEDLNGKIYAGTGGNGVWVSSDEGATWEQTTLNVSDVSITSFISNDDFIYSSMMYGGVFRSNKDNIKWEPIFSYKYNNAVVCLESRGDNIYTGTVDQGGIYRSSDKGETWDYGGYEGMVNMDITAILSLSEKLFAGSWGGGIFVSEDNGDTWTLSGLAGKRIYFIEKINDVIYAGTSNSGIYISSDEGQNWKTANNGLVSLVVKSICSQNTDLFIGLAGGVYRSSDNGNIWVSVNSGLTNNDILALESYDNYIFAATYGNGVFVSSDSGESWTNLGTELNDAKVVSLHVSGTTLLAGTEGLGTWSFDLNKITSVEDNLSENNLTVYPSPASDYIDISNLTNSNEIQIRNIFGESVMSVANILTPTQRIDISSLPSGIYFIQYGKISRKFVVVR